MTLTIIEPSDEKLMAAARSDAGLLDRLKKETLDAFLAARNRLGDYQVLDELWRELQRTWQRTHATSVAANLNSPADQAARLEALRETQKALEYYKGVSGEGMEKPVPAAPTALQALRLQGISDSPLERAFAASSASVAHAPIPVTGDARRQTFTPKPDGKLRTGRRAA